MLGLFLRCSPARCLCLAGQGECKARPECAGACWAQGTGMLVFHVLKHMQGALAWSIGHGSSTFYVDYICMTINYHVYDMCYVDHVCWHVCLHIIRTNIPGPIWPLDVLTRIDIICRSCMHYAAYTHFCKISFTWTDSARPYPSQPMGRPSATLAPKSI